MTSIRDSAPNAGSSSIIWTNKVLVVDAAQSTVDQFQTFLQPFKLNLNPGLVSQKLKHLDLNQQTLASATTVEISYEVFHCPTANKALSITSQAAAHLKPFNTVVLCLEGSELNLTVDRIWAQLPATEIVVVTKENDESWQELVTHIGLTERLSFVEQPLTKNKITQLSLNISKRNVWAKITQDFSSDTTHHLQDKIQQLENLVDDTPAYAQTEPRDLDRCDDFVPRILICDDNPSIHDDFRKVLCKKQRTHANLDDFEAVLFDDEPENTVNTDLDYEIDSAFQGKDAYQKVIKAAEEGRPYSMIFMDVRMPPGWDGIETIERIWRRFPYIEMVIVTAHSDYSWEEIVSTVGVTNRLFFLKKPFDTSSVKQMALSLTRKARLSDLARGNLQELREEVDKRNSQLFRLIEEM